MRGRSVAWILLVALALASAACTTEIRFANRLPGGTMENIRWEPDDGDVTYSPQELLLLPGATSANVRVWGDAEESSGTLSFDLVVGGSRVSLVAEQEFEAVKGESTTFAISSATPVRNPLVEQALRDTVAVLGPRP